MMKLIGGVPAVGFADIPYFFILFGTPCLGVQVQLDRAFYILAEFPALVIHIPFN